MPTRILDADRALPYALWVMAQRELDGREVMDRLISLGLEFERALEVLCSSVDEYDRERKERGKPTGPLGYVAQYVFRHLAHGVAAFEEFTPYRSRDIALEINRSLGAVSRALKALEEHGFISLHKVGYSFSYRLRVQEEALRSLVRSNSSPGLNEYCHELAAQVETVLTGMSSDGASTPAASEAGT
ncbi:MAG TPA: hypothetical protein VF614_14265 [Chthoniobacteraceae bacterium]|jgi:predicted transcriptional regulator